MAILKKKKKAYYTKWNWEFRATGTAGRSEMRKDILENYRTIPNIVEYVSNLEKKL